MNAPSHYSRLNTLSLWLLSQKAWKQAVVGGAFYFVVLMIVMAITGLLLGNGFFFKPIVFIILIFTTGIPAIIFAVLYPFALKLVVRRLTGALGFAPTPREQVDLRVWFKHGTLPESERLRNALSRYLEFIKPFALGQRLYAYPWVNNLIFVLFVFNILTTILRLSTGKVSPIDIVTLTVFILFAFATLPVRFKNGNPLVRLMTRRICKQYQTRLAETT